MRDTLRHVTLCEIEQELLQLCPANKKIGYPRYPIFTLKTSF